VTYSTVFPPHLKQLFEPRDIYRARKMMIRTLALDGVCVVKYSKRDPVHSGAV